MIKKKISAIILILSITSQTVFPTISTYASGRDGIDLASNDKSKEHMKNYCKNSANAKNFNLDTNKQTNNIPIFSEIVSVGT